MGRQAGECRRRAARLPPPGPHERPRGDRRLEPGRGEKGSLGPHMGVVYGSGWRRNAARVGAFARGPRAAGRSPRMSDGRREKDRCRLCLVTPPGVDPRLCADPRRGAFGRRRRLADHCRRAASLPASPRRSCRSPSRAGSPPSSTTTRGSPAMSAPTASTSIAARRPRVGERRRSVRRRSSAPAGSAPATTPCSPANATPTTSSSAASTATRTTDLRQGARPCRVVGGDLPDSRDRHGRPDARSVEPRRARASSSSP